MKLEISHISLSFKGDNTQWCEGNIASKYFRVKIRIELVYCNLSNVSLLTLNSTGYPCYH